MDIDKFPLPYKLSDTVNGEVTLEAFEGGRLVLMGLGSNHVPVQHFADSIAASDDEQFVQTAEDVIWDAAYANSRRQPLADGHWKAAACYYEALRRGNPGLYQAAYDRAVKSARRTAWSVRGSAATAS